MVMPRFSLHLSLELVNFLLQPGSLVSCLLHLLVVHGFDHPLHGAVALALLLQISFKLFDLVALIAA